MRRLLFLVGIGVLMCSLLSAQMPVTFAEHIAPIIFKNCAPCHHPGTAAPFSLLSYDDVARRARMIEFVTQTRYMPPWKADPGYRHFANEKLLDNADIDLIKQWVVQKMPQGKKRRMPAVPKFKEGFIGRDPDLALTVQQPFTVTGDGQENFIFFVIPFEFDSARAVESIEFISTNYKAVHHSNFGIYEVDPSIDIYSDTMAMSANDLSRVGPRFSELTRHAVYYNGWIPGSTPVRFPEGMGFNMPRRGVVVLTTHYGPSPVEISEKTSLHFFFSKKVIERTVETLNMGSSGAGKIYPPLIIFPNEVNDFKASYEVRKPISLMYVWPHMHLLGKSYKAYYVTQARDTVPLVRIKQWDFNWQEAYEFPNLIKVPAGAVIVVEGTYDNTADNLKNPFSPPRMIISDGLMGTKNEMLNLIMVYLEYQDGDENLTLQSSP